MFGILKVNLNKTASPLCYCSDEKEARKLFEEMSKSTNVPLQLVANFDPKVKAMKLSNHTVLEESDPSQNKHLTEIKKYPVLKKKYRYEYVPIQKRIEFEKKLKAQEEEAKKQQENEIKQQQKVKQNILKSSNTVQLKNCKNNNTGLPIDYYIKKPNVNTPIKRYLFYLVDKDSNLILLSELPWSLEYDKNFFRIKKENSNIHVEGYWLVECYAQNKTEAIKFCKSKIREYFKGKKKKK